MRVLAVRTRCCRSRFLGKLRDTRLVRASRAPGPTDHESLTKGARVEGLKRPASGSVTTYDRPVGGLLDANALKLNRTNARGPSDEARAESIEYRGNIVLQRTSHPDDRCERESR